MEENPRKKRRTESSVGENIIVAGGELNDSVEMFNWRQRTWSPLQSMPQELSGATSFVYNDYVTIVGGYGFDEGYVSDMIGMNIDPYPDLSKPWIVPPAKLPAQLAHHSSVLYDESLIVAGGFEETLHLITLMKCTLFHPILLRPYPGCQNQDKVIVRWYSTTVC